MSAGRIIDDHLELANIGTKTHAQIDTHIADPSAHHIKYIDAEAVSAIAAADGYLKNTGDVCEGNLDVGTNTTSRTFTVWNKFWVRSKAGENVKFELHDADVNHNMTNFAGGMLSDTLALISSYGSTLGGLSFNGLADGSAGYCMIFSALTMASTITLAPLEFTASKGGNNYNYIGNNEPLVTFSNGVYLTSGGRISKAHIYGDGRFDSYGDRFRIRIAKTLASAGAAGNQGEICWDANYFYVCVATNTWRRIAHAAW